MATLLPDPDKTDRVLVTLAAEALKHARQHLLAARAVLDAGIWPVAFSNAALALEEAGKGILCTSVLLWSDEERQEAQEAFPKALNSHEAKAAFSYIVLRMVGEEMPASLEELYKGALKDARRTNKNKMRGFYTDSNATGNVLKPSDITEEQARHMVRVVESVIAFTADAEEALSHPELYLRLVRQVRGCDAYASLAGGGDPSGEDGREVITAVRALTSSDELVPDALRGTRWETIVDQLLADAGGPALPSPAASPDERAGTAPHPGENVTGIT